MSLIRTAGAIALVAATATCGARSDLWVPPIPPPEPECDIHSDCPGWDDRCAPVRCLDTVLDAELLPTPPPGKILPARVCAVVEETDCDDGDPCTLDGCDSLSGECTYGPATLDLDEDGHTAPLPGTVAGEPDSCGDDCNDASAAAFPGNPEICDGVDNDCNGVVDDGAEFLPLGEEVRVSEDRPSYGTGGLAFDGERYMSIYTSLSAVSSEIIMYQTALLPDGTKVAPVEETFTFQNADSAGGPIVWVGDRYGVAWQDRRDGEYEVYFSILKPNGDKATPDTRLTFEGQFSINVHLGWNGSEFIVTWQDDRSGLFEVMGQRVSVDGVPIGGNVTLSEAGFYEDESPKIASGEKTLGLVYTNGVAGTQLVRFKSLEQNTLAEHSPLIDLSDGVSVAVYPTIVWNEDRYVIAWHHASGSNKAVYATTVSEDGQIINPPTALSAPGPWHSRDPLILPLGDRMLFVYADNHEASDLTFELYSRMVDNNLVALGPEMRLTNAPADSVEPIASFGPEGNVGILFRDDRSGEQHVWFTRLGCVVAAP